MSSIVAAITGVLNYRFNARAAKGVRDTEAAQRWSMHVWWSRDGQLVATIEYAQTAPPIRVLDLTASAPRGTRIQTFRQERGVAAISPISGRPTVPMIIVPDEDGMREVVVVSRDSNERTIGGGTFQVLVELPPRPIWSRKVATRLRISVRSEARDASRRVKKIAVTSEEIPWRAWQSEATASNADNTST